MNTDIYQKTFNKSPQLRQHNFAIGIAQVEKLKMQYARRPYFTRINWA